MEERSPCFSDPILALVARRGEKRAVQGDSEKENGPAQKRRRLSDCDRTDLSGSTDAPNAPTRELQSLSSDDSNVPDTHYYVAREDVLAAASRYKRKRPPVSDSSDTDSEYNYLLGPPSKRRKKDNSKYCKEKGPKLKHPKSTVKAKNCDRQAQNGAPSHQSSRTPSTPTPYTQSRRSTTSHDGRAMVTAVKAAAKSQRLLEGYPLPTDQYPANFTLKELCSEYPNHLFGTNLHPFLQHRWSPNRIVALMPPQDHISGAERVTVNAINSRLKKVKAALERAGEYQLLLRADKTHAEGMLEEAQEEGGDNSDGTGSSRTEDISNDSEMHVEQPTS